MKLSKGALNTLKLIVEKRSTKQIAIALKKSVPQTSRYLKELKDNNLLNKDLTPTYSIITNFLLRTIENNEQIIPVIADSGILILTSLLEPKTVNEIIVTSRIMAYKKLNQAKKFNIIKKEKNLYQINKTIWPDLYNLLSEIKVTEEETDKNIPIDSVIYKKDKI